MKREKPRRRRGVPSGKRSGFVLTDRDVGVLRFVAIYRSASTVQIAREYFPGVVRCRRRIRALLDGGLVRCLVVSSNVPNVVLLTAKGRDALRDHDPKTAEGAVLVSAVNIVGLTHRLAVVDALSYLTALVTEKNLNVLNSHGPSSAWVIERLGALRLAPDGLTEIGLPDGSVLAIALEVDVSTEAQTVLRSKFEKYRAALVETECVHELWVVASGGEARIENIRQTVIASGIAHATRVIPHSHVVLRPVRPPPSFVGKADSGAAKHAAAGDEATEGLNSPRRTNEIHVTASRVQESGPARDDTPDGTAEGRGQ